MTDLETVRAQYRRHLTKRYPNRAQLAAAATVKANCDRRLAQARAYAAQGLTCAEAAVAMGTTETSLKSLLYRRLGSRVWPPK